MSWGLSGTNVLHYISGRLNHRWELQKDCVNYTRLLVALTNHKNGDIRRKIVLRVSIAEKHKRVSRDALLPGRF